MECLNNYGLYPRPEGWGFTPREDKGWAIDV